MTFFFFPKTADLRYITAMSILNRFLTEKQKKEKFVQKLWIQEISQEHGKSNLEKMSEIARFLIERKRGCLTRYPLQSIRDQAFNFDQSLFALAESTCSNLKKWKILLKSSGAGCEDHRGIVNMQQFFFPYLLAPFSTEVEQNCIMWMGRKLCM